LKLSTHPDLPAPGTALCRIDELADDNGLERRFGDTLRLVLFRVPTAPGGVRCYENLCPHAGIPMQFSDDVFCVHDIDGRRDLLCAHHSALFHLDDGLCHDGPCVGERLILVPVVVDGDGWIRVDAQADARGTADLAGV
jgi:nitrite reductase/ring-hydroxylating ferredoxin subunit